MRVNPECTDQRVWRPLPWEGAHFMKLIKNQLSTKIGAPPGTVVHIGKKHIEDAVIELFNYNTDSVQEYGSIEFPRETSEGIPRIVQWYNVTGLHDVDLITRIGAAFNIHPLALESITDTEQLPKIENFDDHILIILKMIYVSQKTEEIRIEQLSLVLMENIVISFQEAPRDVFDPIRERIRKGGGFIRKRGADYLMYALVDAVVDEYFSVLETMGEWMTAMEDEMFANSSGTSFQTIHNIRRDLLVLKRAIWPVRELISTLSKTESPLIRRPTVQFLRDVQDHSIHIIDTVETYREVVSSLRDTHISLLSNKMNEIMKVLTIIATLFIPLTFIAGIYGMNFEHMPELKWRLAYPIGFWILMFIIGGGLTLYFRRKKWL